METTWMESASLSTGCMFGHLQLEDAPAVKCHQALLAITGLAVVLPINRAPYERCVSLFFGNPKQCRKSTNSWFNTLPLPNITDIEVRICRDELRMHKDLGLTILELYVQ